MAAPPTAIPSRDLARIRQVLARELETINEYEQLAREAESAEIRSFFLHLAEEEKEHVAEAIFLIGTLDAGQRAQFDKDFTQAHFTPSGAAAPPSGLAVSGPTGRAASPSGLTVSAPSGAAPANAPASEQPRSYLPPTHKLPRDPGSVVHALPAPPSPSAGRFTVGPLKGGQD